jgi:hypothetical protein
LRIVVEGRSAERDDVASHHCADYHDVANHPRDDG